MDTLISLDAHAHLDPSRFTEELAGTGAVLAMSLSLNEAERALSHHEGLIAWGAGCHPRKPKSQTEFNAQQFRQLVQKSAVAGEIGLDGGSRVPMDKQLSIFRQELDVLADCPRLVSIHAYAATGRVIEELQRRPVAAPVLHGWTGSSEETRQAVALGCYFSIHSAVARYSRFRLYVPRERILVESDHGYTDPPAAIPCRIGWVEYLVAQQYRMDVTDLRRLVWHNFAAIIRATDTLHLLPETLAAIIAGGL